MSFVMCVVYRPWSQRNRSLGYVRDKVGNVLSTEVEQRLRDVGHQLARFAYLHTSEAVLEFLREWERAPVNPGGGRRVA